MKSNKRKRQKRQDTLVLRLLIIVAAVLVIFEGRLVATMITHSASMRNGTVQLETDKKGGKKDAVSDTAKDSEDAQDSDAADADSETSGNTSVSSNSGGSLPLAGLSTMTGITSDDNASQNSDADEVPTVSNPDSTAIVQKMSTPVDDSYFSDAVFIGDSRMQGFQKASGITQGTFFTSVGMNLSKMAKEAIIPAYDGSNITVAAALSGGTYNKIYIMLGANDLGEYDWNHFYEGFIAVTKRFREIQPNAAIYVCSCIYVDESKVTTSYVNNANVEKINSLLLQICEEQGYHYINFNEFLTNGYGALKPEASSDGVHLYGEYCQQMLTYLKNHYVEVDVPETAEETEVSSEAVTEAEEQE